MLPEAFRVSCKGRRRVSTPSAGRPGGTPLMWRILAFAALAVGLTGVASAQRLPKLAAPVSYRIALVPDLAKGDLTGDETIVLRIAQPTKSIVLSSVGFELSKATVTASGVGQPAAVSLDPAAETATLTVEKTLEPGDAEIWLSFTGQLRK